MGWGGMSWGADGGQDRNSGVGEVQGNEGKRNGEKGMEEWGKGNEGMGE